MSAAERTTDDGNGLVRPQNALDPLDSPGARHSAFSSLMRPDDPSTPERPRFPNFTQLPDRNTPLSHLRMPSPYPTSPQSNKSTTPMTTPPRPPPKLHFGSTTPVTSPSQPGASNERTISEDEQRDGPSEPRSPTMTVTRPVSNFGHFEHGLRPSLTLHMPTTRRSDLRAGFERIAIAAPKEGVPSPDETPKPPPKSPDDEPPACQTVAFDTSSPGDRPSFRASVFFQQLNTTQQSHAIEASASGFYDLNEREMKLIAHHGVQIRDFAFEARAEKEKSEAEAKRLQYPNPEEDVFPESECPDISEAEAEAESSNVPPAEEEMTADSELGRERSFRNIYGSFAYERMMKKKEREEREEREEGSSDDDDWNGLIVGGNMGYGS